jgi:hypothetical protein
MLLSLVVVVEVLDMDQAVAVLVDIRPDQLWLLPDQILFLLVQEGQEV